MNQLSKEAKQAIKDKIYGLTFSECYESGAEIALTNPEIFNKAGLISLEDAMVFAEWYAGQDTWEGDRYREVSELFQIYKQQK